MHEKHTVRLPIAAGLFYEGSPDILRKNIDEYLEHARVPKLKSTVRGLISPHAGYVYSGFTAAHAYKMIEGVKYDCVIVVGPSHREYFNGVSIYPGDTYETPLGTIPINKEIREALLKEKNVIVASDEGHRSEHSIEVQLPFLQCVLGDFSFVPIIMGDQRRELCNELTEAIVRVGRNRNILLVASSDLSHYHPYDEAVILDNRVISELEKFNPETFINKIEEHSFEACGGGPIAAVMNAARQLGANKTEILYYCNSGDITGEKGGVVGYLAAAFV
ncbi:MAG: AmmeMemoRadiSam system protein B [Bacteroidota bacterium]|jgi:AmmeMemoRadiSam system protein B